MEDCYKGFLDSFFYRIIGLRHSVSRINNVLKADVERLLKSEVDFISGSSLIISDWTSPTDQGWEINFHTGISKVTRKESYKEEVEKIVSSKCCLSYAQAFEALEKFFKDCVYYKITNDNDLRVRLGYNDDFTREKVPGGDSLYKLLKVACGEKLSEASRENNKNIRFKEFWSVLSETRHAITHSSSYLKSDKVNKTKYHLAVFNHLFKHTIYDNNIWFIELDYKMLDKLLKYIAEFAYQIYKSLAVTEVVKNN